MPRRLENNRGIVLGGASAKTRRKHRNQTDLVSELTLALAPLMSSRLSGDRRGVFPENAIKRAP